jgi:hypothetical protein
MSASRGIPRNQIGHPTLSRHCSVRSRSLPGDGYPEWVQPVGAHDAYQIGDRVTWADKNWESTIPTNTTEPGQNLEHGYWIEV